MDEPADGGERLQADGGERLQADGGERLQADGGERLLADGRGAGTDGNPGRGRGEGRGEGRGDVSARLESLDDDERERVRGTVADLTDLLGRAHGMAILGEFAVAGEPLRFGDLEAALDVAPTTLSTRLEEFTDAGLLERQAYDEVPPRVEYEPTPAAEALFPAFEHVHAWAIDNEL